MTDHTVFPLDGGQVRYRLTTRPRIVHCCHCRWCQRESGAAFALNALIESERVVHLRAEPELLNTPSMSGAGQRIARRPQCRVALRSHYAGAGPILHFVRVGTLDAPERLPPDIHIFTASKQPWVVLPAGATAVPEFYDPSEHWSAESLERRQAFLPQLRAYRAARAAEAARSPPGPQS